MEFPLKADILKGKVALLTGGGSGIGFELATQFGKHGAAAVAIMGRRKEVLDSAVSVLQSHGIQAIGFQGNVRKKEDAARVVDSTVEHFGRLDILVNGAAGNFLVPSEDLSPKGFRTVIDIDSVGTFTMCHAAFKYLKKGAPGRGPSSGGVILNISATLHYTASWYQIHPSAAKVCQNIMLIVASSPPSSKPCPNYGVCYHVHLCGIIFYGLFSMRTLLSFQQAAVDSITRSLALEWGTDYDIRVNGIAPGPIADTTGMSKLVPQETKSEARESMPLYKMGEKWDCAMAALYLASDAGKYVNGTILIVDGGLWLSKPRFIAKDNVKQLSQVVEKRSRTAPSSKL